MSGGGMGFIVDPPRRETGPVAGDHADAGRDGCIAGALCDGSRVYDFAINEHGTVAQLLEADFGILPPEYYSMLVPAFAARGPRAPLACTPRRTPLRSTAPASPFRAFGDSTRHFDSSATQSGRRGAEALTSRPARGYGFDRGSARTYSGRFEKRPHWGGAEPLACHDGIEDIRPELSSMRDGPSGYSGQLAARLWPRANSPS